MSDYQGDAIFWVEVDRIVPNPYQPRKEFDEAKLTGLAESIRQYGLLQPLTVTKRETEKADGGLAVSYELIAGERRLRASKIAGLRQVPVIIRNDEQTNQMKLELAIIENIQREDLNPIDRAKAFAQLAEEFGFTHSQIAKKVGKSREYVSNSLRLLGLPDNIQMALSEGNISEGHARPLLMLSDRPDEQITLFKEISFKKLTVREAEGIARRIATDKIRKKERGYDPEIIQLEQQLTTTLGTRVQIESKEVGGKVVIDFFSNDDLRNLLAVLGDQHAEALGLHALESSLKKNQEAFIDDSSPKLSEEVLSQGEYETSAIEHGEETPEEVPQEPVEPQENNENEDNDEEDNEDDGDLYSIRNFSV